MAGEHPEDRIPAGRKPDRDRPGNATAGNAALEDTAPEGTAPEGTAPEGTAPEESVPDGNGNGTGRPRRVPALAAVLLLTATAAVAVVFLRDGGEAESAEPPGPPSTTRVTRGDLVTADTVNGTLEYEPGQPLPGRLSGTVTWLPRTGAVIGRGEQLYRLDDKPVLLFRGRIPAYRELSAGADPGRDVRQLERNLAHLGYTGFTVDDAYTDGTAYAVRRWQRSLGLPATGRVELGRVLFAPGDVRVGGAETGLGEETAPGSPVLATTRTGRSVTAEVKLAQQRLFTKGGKVTVALPGGKTLRGTVSSVGSVVDGGGGGGEGGGDGGEGGNGGGPGDRDETVTVRITLRNKDVDKAAGSLTRAPVRVSVESERREDVLSVPVAALLALREGGYGVELVEGGESRVLPVEPGLFADGRVEISGPGIAEGDTVGTPAL
ncbi:peptidoglycan-binding protein [Streptomyces albus]|uniref:peptidoglycan-binding protein n=1 Tax=Streptomyces albus TaxID=1888 RepID=UPI00068F7CEE|nr:peptidoglycan-binding protein [Streptomyces albus]